MFKKSDKMMLWQKVLTPDWIFRFLTRLGVFWKPDCNRITIIFFKFLFLLLLKTIFNKKTLCVVTMAMICSNLATLWKFQYFQTPIYNPLEHLWWSCYCKNSEPLSMFTKELHHNACLGSKYASAFWRLFKRFISLKYFTL